MDIKGLDGSLHSIPFFFRVGVYSWWMIMIDWCDTGVQRCRIHFVCSQVVRLVSTVHNGNAAGGEGIYGIRHREEGEGRLILIGRAYRRLPPCMDKSS